MPHINNSNDSKEQSRSKWIYVRWFILRAVLVLYDIIAVNAAYLLALFTRFYVAKEFHDAAARYIPAYIQYAPIYTVFCVIVFIFYRLYSGMWKYAGLHDLNRVLNANAVCFAGHVAGTLLFGIRMPISFYAIGAVVQLCLITVSRFFYRLLVVEKKMLFDNGTVAANAMIVGVSSTARSALRAMERESAVRPVCMVDYKNQSFGLFFDGLPVVNGVDDLAAAIEKYHVQLVLLASTVMPQQIRAQVQETCAQCGVECQDYAGYFQNTGAEITLKSLAERCTGPVEISLHGSKRRFEDGEQAVAGIIGKYAVKSISAKDGELLIELADKNVVQNDLNEEWVKNQEKETGEEISFF